MTDPTTAANLAHAIDAGIGIAVAIIIIIGVANLYRLFKRKPDRPDDTEWPFMK